MIIPTLLWNDFRGLNNATKEERKIAHVMINSHTASRAALMDLGKFHYKISCLSTTGEIGAEVLAGRAKVYFPEHYPKIELDNMSAKYAKCMLEPYFQ